MQHRFAWYLALSLGIASSLVSPTRAQPAAGRPAAAATATASATQPASLHCQVFNEAGQGLDNAIVEVQVLGPAGWTAVAGEYTGRTGECDLPFPTGQPGMVMVHAAAQGYHPGQALYVPNPRHAIPWVTIALKGAKELMGRAVTENNEGVAGATVVIQLASGQTKDTLTSSAGYFEFQNLMPGPAVLQVNVPTIGIGAYGVDLSADEIEPIQIVLKAQRPVVFRLLDEQGQPLAGKMIQVLGPTADNAVTNEKGEIRIKGVGAGRTRVLVQLIDEYYRFEKPTMDFEIDEGEESTEIEAMATHGGQLKGQVVDESGEGIPAAVVWLAIDGNFGPQMTCDIEGKFEFNAIPADEYLVAAGHATYAFAVAPADIEEGKTVELKLQLAGGASLTGVVVDAAGAPVPRAVVKALAWQPAAGPTVPAGKIPPIKIPWRAARADAEGKFLIQFLPAGRIELQAVPPSGGPPTELEVQIAPGKEPPPLKIRLGGAK